MTEPGAAIEIPLFLRGAEETTVLFANHFLIQEFQGDFFLTAGQLVPPPLVGTMEERREQAKQVTSVSVNVIARLALTRGRLAEVTALLQSALERYDESTKRERRDA